MLVTGYFQQNTLAATLPLPAFVLRYVMRVGPPVHVVYPNIASAVPFGIASNAGRIYLFLSDSDNAAVYVRAQKKRPIALIRA